jgi:hypothetical protein
MKVSFQAARSIGFKGRVNGLVFRSLRGTVLARPAPSCAHDDDRLRFPPVSPAQNSKAGKKNQRAAAKPTLRAVRQAILELIARPPPKQSPHCGKWICSEKQRE